MSNLQDITVAELMTGDVVAVDLEDTISDVRQRLTHGGLHAVPVLADENVVGVLTLADCHDAFGFEIAADAITNPPLLVESDWPVTNAVKVMYDEHIHHLPVTDDSGNLVGILSSFDLLRHLAGQA